MVLLQQREGDCIKEGFCPLVSNQNVVAVLLKQPTVLYKNCCKSVKAASFVCIGGRAQP